MPDKLVRAERRESSATHTAEESRMTVSVATAPIAHSAFASPTTITLLDLVVELNATGASDREVVAAVMDLLETGRVRLIGEICEEHLLAH